ncbi:RhoGAP domain containing protein [Entamoeba histolytica HM-1:IMSS-B]|uniref:RhoGAP domain containing protein n=6 Tax=Entamoeba histolytica TaxID=5759 RepID=C4M8N2_ENTH1|nr:RhoGAP domain containing protein [Entamoeba histolytica HM-1:IMSS]EMD44822.1 RhoGAP domain containing protein [Entamoeba histolytica KU27]EMH77032.1 RhoGAP domain containing protein [Entamoeba histolytica HM-1:IMSS-B]ENY65286.1 RhoGAP domain containing protein [Entamoeba histolytica HM-1:IMSS-A]GAT97963.1 rhogap domain containing protein [Entamoeba histolytica]EAL43467.1 RhoGAP domain containing protein [Entamoeba histolytica HM-1:IMSS]|eukprot:XP_648857.1 RhoGAP domain containing protein [Entamoeba histolytica HM-1:IMSS]
MSTNAWKGFKKATSDIKESILMTDEKRKNIQQFDGYWQKQQKFFQSTNKILNKFVELIDGEVRYLKEHWECSGMGQQETNIIGESLTLMMNIFLTTSKNLKCIEEITFKPIFKQINDVKNHLTDENEEIVIQKYYQLEKMIAWNNPLTYNNYIHQFVMMFDAGSVYFNENEAMNILISNAQELKQQYVIQNNQPSALYCNKTIESILVAEQRTKNQLPIAVESIYNYLYDKGFTVPGIFREITTGNKHQIDELYLRMAITSFEDLQPDLVAAVFKRFLRDLPTHVIDKQQTNSLINNYNSNGIHGIKSVITSLPVEHLTLFKYIMKLSYKISAYEDINLMNSKNIAVCLTPSLLTFDDTDTILLTKGINVLSEIITHFNDIFPNDVDNLVYRKSRVLKRTTKIMRSTDADVLGILQKKTNRKRLPPKTKPLPQPNQTHQPKSLPQPPSPTPLKQESQKIKGVELKQNSITTDISKQKTVITQQTTKQPVNTYNRTYKYQQNLH